MHFKIKKMYYDGATDFIKKETRQYMQVCNEVQGKVSYAIYMFLLICCSQYCWQKQAASEQLPKKVLSIQELGVHENDGIRWSFGFWDGQRSLDSSQILKMACNGPPIPKGMSLCGGLPHCIWADLCLALARRRWQKCQFQA